MKKPVDQGQLPIGIFTAQYLQIQALNITVYDPLYLSIYQSSMAAISSLTVEPLFKGALIHRSLPNVDSAIFTVKNIEFYHFLSM